MSTEEEAKAPADESDSKPVTMADLKAMFGGKDLNTTVHAAASNHAKRSQEAFEKRLAAAREEDRAAFEARLAELTESFKATTKTQEQPKQDGGAAPPAVPKLEDHPEFLAMRKQAETQAKELEHFKKRQAEEQKKAADARARERKMRLQTETDTLLSKSVAPGRASHARLFLTHPDNNRIAYEDEDSDTLIFIDDDGDKVSLEKGLRAWLKNSEDAKHFLPPLNPRGSGGGPGQLPGNGASDSIADILSGAFMAHAKGEIRG